MTSLNESIREFLADKIVVGDPLLPTRYAEFDRIDVFQIGFRAHGRTGESLVSETDGGWKPGWYAIAMTGLDDPVFIDTADVAKGYPVYTAPHGAGRWDPVQIAPSLEALGRLLGALTEVREDIHQFARIITDNTGPQDVYWRDVLDARREAETSGEPPLNPGGCDPADFEEGNLIVTDIGPRKLKIVQVVSNYRGLSLKDTLALAGASEFEAGRGLRLQLRRLSDRLEALGATLEFRVER